MTIDTAPFLGIPSGVDLAHYFWDETDHRNPGYDGIDLYREGNDYCYLWVEAMVDHDMWHSYLLEVRTHVGVKPGEFGETRDFLFLHVGGDTFDVEWHNKPIRFDAPHEAHQDYFHDGMLWFLARIEKALEDHGGNDA